MRKLVAATAVAVGVLGLAAVTVADISNRAPAKVSQPATPIAGAAVLVNVEGGHGTGVHIGNGLILTAAHVVHDSKEIRLVTDLGEKVEAVVLWENAAYDLALVQTKSINAMVAPLACRAPVVDEPVSTVGNPLGLEFVSIHGRVAAATMEREPWKFAYLVNMTVVPGMSGGPLYDSRGNVIGIVTGVAVASRSLVGIGYVVPSTAACTLMAKV